MPKASATSASAVRKERAPKRRICLHAARCAFLTPSRNVDTGGPVGKTKQTSKAGIEDISNNIAGFVKVQAESQEAAAKLFENHPHFSIFPGDGVEVMECLPIPTNA